MSRRPPSVLVTDAGYVPGLTVVRSLGRNGWRVVACHGEARPTWSRSRYADSWHTVPSPEYDPESSAKRIAELVAAEKVDLVFPTTDKSIYPIDANRAMFEPQCTLALPAPGALRTARDKSRTTALAAALGIPTPRSVTAEDHEQARRAGDEIGWPVVVKPLSSHAPDEGGRITTRSVFRTGDADELDRAIASGRLGGFPVLVQELVEGAGLGIELLMWQGETIATFQHRRLHEVPLTGGMSSYRVAEHPNPVLLDYGQRILAELGWNGLAMVEFKEGRDGPALLEINGRIWGSIALPVRAGVDFPALLAGQYLEPGRLPTPSNQLEAGVSCRNLELELRWIALAARRRLGRGPAAAHLPRFEILRTLAALVSPGTELDAQVGDDRRPGLYDGLRSMASLFEDLELRRRLVPQAGGRP